MTIGDFDQRRALPPEVAGQLAAWRERAGMSKRALARRAGIDPRHVRYLEAGARCPSAAVARSLTAALGLTEDESRLLEAAASPDRGRSYPKVSAVA